MFSNPVNQGLFYNKWAIPQLYHGAYKLFFFQYFEVALDCIGFILMKVYWQNNLLAEMLVHSDTLFLLPEKTKFIVFSST
jgi:hypothetical protein